MSLIEFSDWLQQQMDRLGLNGNQLSIKAGIDRAIVSRVLNRERLPSPESLSSIARALDMPPETVFREAGLLPRKPDVDEKLEQWMYLFDQLTEKDQFEMIELVKVKIELQKRKAWQG